MQKLLLLLVFVTISTGCLISFEKKSSGCGCGCAPPRPCCPPPPSCGCGCGRKKRETLISHADENKCNSDELKELLEKNMKGSIVESLVSLKEATKEHTDFLITCAVNLAYMASADEFCQIEKDNQQCAILRLNVPQKVVKEEEEKEEKMEDEEKKIIRAGRLLL